MAWQLQLVAPSGRIFPMGSMGYMGSCYEHGYIFPTIRKFLRENRSEDEFIQSDPQQLLINSNFHKYHNYRLCWGTTKPGESHASYPNEGELNWTLYNGAAILQGSLPVGWWELDEEDKWCLIEQQVNSL